MTLLAQRFDSRRTDSERNSASKYKTDITALNRSEKQLPHLTFHLTKPALPVMPSERYPTLAKPVQLGALKAKNACFMSSLTRNRAVRKSENHEVLSNGRAHRQRRLCPMTR